MGTTVTPRQQLMLGVPVGILGPFISGLVFTGLLYGRAGFRQLRSRLLKWRVGLGWYAFALLTAPIITTLSLLARSTPPAIAAASDKLGLLLMGIAIGLGRSPIFEEIGWTGFATPELRKRWGILRTGLLMGVLWGVWHFPAFSATGRASAPLSPLVFTAALLFTWLIPYRILMVWLYDHTQSLLLVHPHARAHRGGEVRPVPAGFVKHLHGREQSHRRCRAVGSGGGGLRGRPRSLASPRPHAIIAKWPWIRHIPATGRSQKWYLGCPSLRASQCNGSFPCRCRRGL